MSSAIEKFLRWFDTLEGASDYIIARGQFIETHTNANSFAGAVSQSSGGRPIGSVQFPTIKLTLMGRRDKRGDVIAVEQFAQSVFEAAVETGAVNQCLIHLSPIGSMIGPYYTTEDRPVFGLNFELIT